MDKNDQELVNSVREEIPLNSFPTAGCSGVFMGPAFSIDNARAV